MSLIITPVEYFHRHTLGTAANMEIILQIDFPVKWFLSNDPSMLFSLDGAKVPEISGNGTRAIPIGLTNDVNYYDEGIYEMKLRVFTLGETEEKILTVYLLVAQGGQILVMPKTLRFEAVRNVEEAPSQRIYLAVNYPSINVTLPPWLEIENQETIGNGHIYDIKPVPQSNTPDKNYSGSVIFDWPIGSLRETVSVSYKINSGYDEAYTRDVHFTRDNDELKFYKTTLENSFLKLIIQVKAFKQTGAVDSDFTLDLDIPFSNHLAVLNLGEEIEPYFADLPYNRLLNIQGVYPPLEVRITALEIRSMDFSVLNQDVLPLQYFLRGRRPLSSIKNPFWISFRPDRPRVISRDAIVSLGVFKPAKKQIQNIEMRRNGALLDVFTCLNHKFGVMRPYFANLFVSMNQYFSNWR